MIRTVLLSLTRAHQTVRQWRLLVDDATCIVPEGETAVDLALATLLSGSTLDGSDTRAASVAIVDTVSRGFSSLPGLVPARALTLDEIPVGLPIAVDGELLMPVDHSDWTLAGRACFTLLRERGVDRAVLTHAQRLHPLTRRNYAGARPTMAGEAGTLSCLYGMREGVFDLSDTAFDGARTSLALVFGITRGLGLARKPLPLTGAHTTALWRAVCTEAKARITGLDHVHHLDWVRMVDCGVLTTNRAWAPTFLLEGPAMADTMRRFLAVADQDLCDVWALGAELAPGCLASLLAPKVDA